MKKVKKTKKKFNKFLKSLVRPKVNFHDMKQLAGNQGR